VTLSRYPSSNVTSAVGSLTQRPDSARVKSVSRGDDLVGVAEGPDLLFERLDGCGGDGSVIGL